MFTTKAEVNVKNSQGVVIASREFQTPTFEGNVPDTKPTDAELEALLRQTIDYFQAKDPNQNGLLHMLSVLSYGEDLKLRGKIRAELNAAAAGPDKAIDKSVKDYIALRASFGKPVTEEAARAKVMADIEKMKAEA